jgi:hypothetical protein
MHPGEGMGTFIVQIGYPVVSYHLFEPRPARE